uniref:Uncharacterized protein n=1 Tax=Arundo donax TaxID=35708 RepID=A0A0A9HN49_ARUDO
MNASGSLKLFSLWNHYRVLS